jgi:hypothetical protein
MAQRAWVVFYREQLYLFVKSWFASVGDIKALDEEVVMGRTLAGKLASLPPARRARIASRAAKLIAEEKSRGGRA